MSVKRRSICAPRRAGVRVFTGIMVLWAIFALQPAAALVNGVKVTAALGVDTVNVFRGQKSRKLNPSVYARFEVERGDWYAGVRASPSSIQGEVKPSLIAYTGYEHAIGGVDIQIGGRFYSFPTSSPFVIDFENDGIIDHRGDKSFFEANAGVATDIGPVRFDLRAYYAPDFFADTGSALYLYTRARTDIGQGFELRVNGGVSRFGESKFHDNYADYGVGIYKTAFGMDFFLSYSDTLGVKGIDDRVVVFGVEKTFTLADGVSEDERRRRKIRNRDWRIDKELFGNIVNGRYYD